MSILAIRNPLQDAVEKTLARDYGFKTTTNALNFVRLVRRVNRLREDDATWSEIADECGITIAEARRAHLSDAAKVVLGEIAVEIPVAAVATVIPTIAVTTQWIPEMSF